MNNSLIIVLVVAALVVLVLIIKKSSGKKTPPVEPARDDAQLEAREETAVAEPEPEAAAEQEEEVEEPAAETLEVEKVEEESEEAEEPEVEEVESEPEVVAESEEEVEETAAAVEESVAEEVDVFEEVEAESVEEVEPPAAEEEIPEPEPEQVAPDTSSAQLTQQAYEERLVLLKEKQLAALTEAIENNEEGDREQFQVELVAITEALTFLNQSYEQEIACRNEARAALDQMEEDLDSADYEQACAAVSDGDTLEAEQILSTVAEKGSDFSALAAYQSGRLAECRMDFSRAMENLEKAVSLDEKNPEYLRSAALLARKMYKHKQALVWLTTLEQVLADQGEDTVDLALARRELAYASALVGQHKKAGAMYKQAMVSLSKLVGKDDPEMGICWLQIGKLQEALGQYEKAEDPYKKALAVMEKAEGERPALGEILDKLAGLYMELEREMEAIPLFERLCTFKESLLNTDKVTLAMTYGNLGEAYRICGKYDESEQNYLRSLTLTEELRGKDHAAVGSILQELAQLCDRQGKKDDAQVHRDRAAAIFQRVLEEQEAAGQEGVNFDL
jgi:tetratricopeptide (TPR) repeat protein